MTHNEEVLDPVAADLNVFTPINVGNNQTTQLIGNISKT